MKSEEKKLILKRIGIFLFFAFIFNYIIGIAFADKKGGITSSTLAATTMIYPAIANVITRVITKEGVKDHYLKANFSKNKSIYIAAALIPLFMAFVTAIALHLYCDSSSNIAEILEENFGEVGGVKMLIALVLGCYQQTIPLLLLGFGEEFGWRAYLTPKLEKLMPRGAAICLTSMIWGVWHAPLVWYGYDFGTNYPGFPYVGVIAMGIVCIPLSYLLSEMTERTKSVYPAMICHMAIDMVLPISTIAILRPESLEKADSLVTGLIVLGLAPAIICFFVLCAKLINKKKAAA